jgi:hydrophobe/amphiphile efflux-1 (HAE1) family protein
MNGFSAIFIHRPVGTILLSLGLLVAGFVAYIFLPVASLPNVEFPTIRVMAGRPGADPSTMAATVAAPLERSLSTISGVTEMTSSSTLGATSITVQFDLARNIDLAARDVQAAINNAIPELPGDLPAPPRLRKANPNAQPVLIIALTSTTLATDALYDLADTIIAQRMSQVDGVAEVQVNGSEQPAIRVRLDPARLAAMNIGLDDVRIALASATSVSPVGAFDGETRMLTLATNGQLRTPEDFANVVIRARNGALVRIGDIAQVERGVRNTRSAGWFSGKPAVLVQITKTPDANVIDTVDGVKALIPTLQKWIPAGVEFNVMSDRTLTIRASVADLQHTLLISIALVMAVVFLFLRQGGSTLAAGVTVPLSLAGALVLMWAFSFTIDTLSLMAIIIAVGFVVDDAIVMIENVHQKLESGMGRIEAALSGARQIGFTVLAISVSLIAAFIPMLFMQGVIGRVFREFSLTMVFAIAVSTIVSLSVTPMICGRLLRRETRLSWFDRALGLVGRAYAATLGPALARPGLSILAVLVTTGLTVHLFRTLPKGSLPQDDIGLVFAWTEAATDVSFPAMRDLQQRATDIINADPSVESSASFIGGFTTNTGRMFIALKPPPARRETAQAVIDRLRAPLANLAGIRTFLVPAQDVRVGGRQGKSNFQFTLWGSSSDEIDEWAHKALTRLRQLGDIVDVSSDRDKSGLEARVVIDRPTAARLGVSISAIDAALANGYSQRQVATIYGERNQYKVVFEIGADRHRDPSDLAGLFVPGAGGAQIPLGALARIERSLSPVAVNHTGLFASATLTYTNAPGVPAERANRAVQEAVLGLHPPDSIHADFAGDAKAADESGASQAWLILAALVCVYLVLGILYESLLHPLTILSTLPSAGLGALLALAITGTELSMIAFTGMILLIGIVKKNGIMLVDFALAAEREDGLSPKDAMRRACAARFRPILMTTLAAMCGALPLLFAEGPGSDLRRPLGIVIVAGLALSQIVTIYTTPVIYVALSRFARGRKASPQAVAAGFRAH